MALHHNTPLVNHRNSNNISSPSVWLKMENLQPTGSFKIRGIGRLCEDAKVQGITQFVSSSGGNAGYAAAYAGRKLEVKTKVFVPNSTPEDIMERIRKLGAVVEVAGSVWDETDKVALEYAKEVDGLYISPFDHPLIWEGNGTIIGEIANVLDKPDAIVLSVGGGGLMCGVLQGLNNNNWEDVPVIAVETEGTASLSSSIKEKKLVTLNEISGVAMSLGAKTVSQKAFDWTQDHQIIPVVVSDKEAIQACVDFKDKYDYFVEPACGASLSIIDKQIPQLEKIKNIVIIVCGGIGADEEKLNSWKKMFEINA
ncbi:MAG: serine dehydratase [Bacteroidetes bacterium]|nr:MAG: serine dehydratase [Bacteroidota bacterium]